MEQVEQVHVQTNVKEEQNIVQQENQHVQMYQVDTIQQDVTDQIIGVQDNHNAQKEITVQAEFHMDVEQENIVVLMEQHHVQISQQDVTEQVEQVHVQMNVREEPNIVLVEQVDVQQYQVDTIQQDVTDQVIGVLDKLDVQEETTVQAEYLMDVELDTLQETMQHHVMTIQHQQ